MDRGPKCGTNPKDHCCYVNGKPCPYLKTTSQRMRKEQGFYWKCALREELGSWEAVHEDPRYRQRIRPEWDKVGEDDCGDYPREGRGCNTCGKNI